MKHQLKEITSCPICEHKTFKSFIKCKDHNFSNDVFTIVECEHCSFKFTNPRPTPETIHLYYQNDNYISHTSSKKGVFNKVYHLVRQYQFSYKWNIIKKTVSNKNNLRLLDFGCGTGEFIHYCKQKNATVFGVEKDDGARSLAIKNYQLNVKKELSDFNENFDVITLWHVFEHIEDFKTLLIKLKKLLNDNGLIILGLPNHNSYDAKTYQENWVAYDVPIHLSHFTRADILKLVDELSFTSLISKPLFFDAYYISMLSAKKSGKQFLGGLKNGWLSNTKAKKSGEYSSLMYILKN